MKTWRKEMGFTIEQAAIALDVGYSVIINLQKGRSELKKIHRLAMAAIKANIKPY